MSIITKSVSGKQYAYLSVREGGRVVHRYLGPIASPQVQQRMRAQKEAAKVPERFYPLFWDTDASMLEIKKHAHYIIERILEFGDLDAVRWLQMVYTVQTILDGLAFSRVVSERSKNFWQLWFEAPHA